MTPQEQLELWVRGESKHNEETNGCVPDFSCCDSKLIWPKEIREIFLKAWLSRNQRIVDLMMMKALVNLLESGGATVYISTGEHMPEENDVIH